ncbi:MAG TPA: hypothetical protein VH252_06830 [Chthoniobacterales bacterium]|jgi:hypothetical protein|nr:hypothetical protein [Chthoniobacterales bacterium]
MSFILSFGPKFFRAPLAFGDLPAWLATFFGALAAGFFATGFFATGLFAGFDTLARVFVTLGRAAFFAGALDFAGFFEFFFFAELAINWETPLVSRARAEAY